MSDNESEMEIEEIIENPNMDDNEQENEHENEQADEDLQRDGERFFGMYMSHNIQNLLNSIQTDNSSNLLNSVPSRLAEILQTIHPDSSFSLNEQTSNTLNSILNSSFYDRRKYKNVLSEKGREDLKIIKYSKELKINLNCPITQTEFIQEMDIVQLPCDHCFNPEAIEKWLTEEKALCPVCRYELDSVEVEDLSNLPNINNSQRPIPSGNSQNLYSFLDSVIEERNEENLQRAIINSLQERDNI